MAFLKKVKDNVNIFKGRKKYNVPLWEYPPFIFFIMGIVIIFAILFAYFVSNQYLAPEYVPLVVLVVAIVLFFLDYLIVNSFQGLAEANLIKGEFMKIISHQLRAPLTNSKWTLEIAMEEENLGKVKEALNTIREQNEKMLMLVDDIVFSLKIERGEKDLLLEKIDIGEIVEKVLKKFSFLAKSHNVEIKVEKDEGLPKILISSARISKAIENLVENSIQYSKEKGGEIFIKIEKKPKKIKFTIKDQGVGMSKEEQKYIFKKFFRSSNILRYQTQGLGLGLCISRSIIEELGGKIYFKSKENEGTIFWFELPIK